MQQKGFTLVELLIVIAILAVLAVTVVVVLNPAELLRQSRDATRVSDMSSINSAVALYLTDSTNPTLWGGSTCSNQGRMTVATSSPFSGSIATSTVTSTAVDGNGWVAVNLQGITGGSPLARLPIDPTNSGSLGYAYACNSLNYELNARLESTKYAPLMGNDKDGGNNANWYEVGNSLTL